MIFIYENVIKFTYFFIMKNVKDWIKLVQR